jgi:hypothetical protein
MKTIRRDETGPVFQGDICIQRASAVPADAKPAKTSVVAHSETGHHHVAERAKVFACDDGLTLYMRAIGKSVDIVHQRPFDTHETIRLLAEPGDVFKVRRQREYVPEGWRRVAD